MGEGRREELRPDSCTAVLSGIGVKFTAEAADSLPGNVTYTLDAEGPGKF